MEIVLRRFGDSEPGPAPGDVEIRSRGLDPGERRALALRVLARGADALPRGEGDARRVVVGCEGTSPTLDEMLAATILVRRAEGRDVPEGR